MEQNTNTQRDDLVVEAPKDGKLLEVKDLRVSSSPPPARSRPWAASPTT